MNETERIARERFVEEQRRAREKASMDRQIQRQSNQDRRDLAKSEGQIATTEMNNQSALERMLYQARIDSETLHHEFTYGEWSKDNDHQRSLELALVELSRMGHAAELQIKVDSVKHEHTKAEKSHDTDEDIRYKSHVTDDEIRKARALAEIQAAFANLSEDEIDNVLKAVNNLKDKPDESEQESRADTRNAFIDGDD